MEYNELINNIRKIWGSNADIRIEVQKPKMPPELKQIKKPDAYKNINTSSIKIN